MSVCKQIAFGISQLLYAKFSAPDTNMLRGGPIGAIDLAVVHI